MSVLIPLSFGVASAAVYGAATVVQHRLAQATSDEGEVSASGLRSLLRRPLFLFAVVGDALGFLLQVVALSAGSVVVIQPLVVLMLPVSLAVSFAFTRRRPVLGECLGVLAVVGGLGTFLAAVGQPSGGQVPRWQIVGEAVVAILVIGALAAVVVRRRGSVTRAVVFGGVAGLYFGSMAVMVDAAASWTSRDGVEGLLESPRGQVCLGGVVVLGIGGMVFTQLSFQLGALGAALPVNLAVDPLIAVLLGATLLHETVPVSGPRVVLYVACLAVVVAGAVRLARPVEDRQDERVPASR